jgi:beta-glucosidase
VFLGDDVAQLYIHESDTSILQPVRKLEGFQRVSLAPHQSRTVAFTLNASNFGFYDNTGQFVVELGSVSVWVGDSSSGGLQSSFTTG